jgi:hypothetical protein
MAYDNQSCIEVNDHILQFDNNIVKVLNGTFQMILPPTFKNNQGTILLTKNKNNEAKRGNKAKKGGGKEGNKKHKNENGNGNLVKNTGQSEKYKMVEGETWKAPLQICSPTIDLHEMRA